MTELDVAESIATGQLPSPQVFANSVYFAVRITGCGTAYRPSIGEFAYRNPNIWQSPVMLRRCISLPVVLEHPEGGTLDGESFQRSTVGVITYSYAKGSEVWGIARIFDPKLAAVLAEPGELVIDTSPAVSFADGTNTLVQLEGGGRLLVEAAPDLLDHLAIIVRGPGVAGGVWSRGDADNAGIPPSTGEQN